jgi:hypothetical protein
MWQKAEANYHVFLTSTKIRLATRVACTWCKCILDVEPEGHRPLGKPRRRWEGLIKICTKETGLAGCIHDLSGSIESNG